MQRQPDRAGMRVGLAGDVMTGRGIDQVLPHPSTPELYEPQVRDAREYVLLAEMAHGRLQAPVDYGYIWGDALTDLVQWAPDARIINLETAVTTSPTYWPRKGINYRMHPANMPCLAVAAIDVCTLANNHVLDWGYAGLAETLAVLAEHGIAAAGAGSDVADAAAPAIVAAGEQGRVLVFAWGAPSSGVPPAWAAGSERAGVNLLPDLSAATAQRIAAQVRAFRQAGDVVVASLHWGGNWGYPVTPAERRFARRLIDAAAVDIVYGHSSHHVRAVEVYQGRLILYGCGDLINDYEGIGGYEAFRPDLGLIYLADLDPADGRLLGLHMLPFQRRKMRLQHVAAADAHWLAQLLTREGRRSGVQVAVQADGSLQLGW